MTDQLKKRTCEEWAEYVLELFNEHSLTEKEACQLLEIKRSQLYDLRKRWLKAEISKKPFSLNCSGQNQKRSLDVEIVQFLHTELSYIKKEARFYRGKFNFAYLSEKIFDKFDHSIHRNTIRRFAIKEGYYEQRTEEKSKPCIRFEMDSIGALFQHDTSRHVWLPHSGRHHDLLMTKDDHSRVIAGFSLREVESAWEHICLARKVFEQYGRPLAYYVVVTAFLNLISAPLAFITQGVSLKKKARSSSKGSSVPWISPLFMPKMQSPKGKSKNHSTISKDAFLLSVKDIR